ncbi:MAG: stage III sporulation protein AF [Clostridiales bacterium]
MDGLKAVIGDIAIVAVLAGFLDIFLPKNNTNYGVKLVFGLYFLAILLNPVITLFTDTDLANQDFTKLSDNRSWEQVELEENAILDKAAASLNHEIEVRLGAIYENVKFTTNVAMNTADIEGVKIEVSGITQGKERVFADKIKEFIAMEYGVKKNKTEVVFK